jgi:hypothetical protein
VTVTSNSRYTQGEQQWVTTTDRGNKQTLYLNTVTIINSPYTAALIHETDTMDLFASRAYGDPKRWWVIADVNPQFFYPLDLIPGRQVRVPL